MKQAFQEIIVLSSERSGTNFLNNVLQNVEGCVGLGGEIFSDHITPVYKFLPELIQPFADHFGVDPETLSSSSYYQIIAADRIGFLDFLARTLGDLGYSAVTFKIFAQHVDKADLEKILARPSAHILFAVRNRIDQAISFQKAKALSKWGRLDNTGMRTVFSVWDFLNAAQGFDRRNQRLFDALKRSGKPYDVLRYETDLDQPQDVITAAVSTALSNIGVTAPLQLWKFAEQIFTKQDRARNWRNRIEDGDQVAAALSGMGLLDYAQSPSICEQLSPTKLAQLAIESDDASDPVAEVKDFDAELLEKYTLFAVICKRPLITVSDITYDRSPLAEWLASAQADLPQSRAVHLVRPTWSMETCDLSPLSSAIKGATVRYPGHRFVVLYQSRIEEARLREQGIETCEAHGGIFVTESHWIDDSLVLNEVPQTDAIYCARLVKWKNHHLAAQIPSVSLAYSPSDEVEMTQDEILSACPQAVFVNDIVGGGTYKKLSVHEMSAAYKRSKVSLALSHAEGFMRAVLESQLCGLPVISVPSTGGRDKYFSADNALIVEPTADAVARGVKEMIDRRLSRAEIRKATLDLLLADRATFEAKVNVIIQSHLGGSAPLFQVSQLPGVNSEYLPFGHMLGMMR